MKRLLEGSSVAALAAALMLAGAHQSEATSAINITNTQGIQDSTTAFLAAGSLLQVIWSPDNVVDHSPVETTFDAAGYNAAGEYLLFETNTPLPGGWAGDLDGTATYDFANPAGLGNSPSDSIAIPATPGFIYGRVFDGPNNASITAANFFYQTDLVALDNDANATPVPDIPDELNFSPAGGPISQTTTPVLPIPEPSAVAFLFLGGLAMTARRRLRG